MQNNYNVGDRFRLTADAQKRYSFVTKNASCYTGEGVFEVSKVALSQEDHPGFDEGVGSALYTFRRVLNPGTPCAEAAWEMPFCVYEFEMELA